MNPTFQGSANNIIAKQLIRKTRVCPTFYMRRNFEILIKTVEQILFDPVPDNCHLPLYTPE
ncbi:hypothetical protein, partial [Desulfobacter sp.]|uniref:hypothetical protein n=1 Tax=Desulfobacter sp. TaxID=2294 RepID=UPI000E86BBF2